MHECEQIPLNDLEDGRWYVGRGRNGNVGMWNGKYFLVIGKHYSPVSWTPRKWVCQPTVMHETYFTEQDGCFQPFLLIDEGVVKARFDTHYAKALTFGPSSDNDIGK
jgi:hypothetical protein